MFQVDRLPEFRRLRSEFTSPGRTLALIDPSAMLVPSGGQARGRATVVGSVAESGSLTVRFLETSYEVSPTQSLTFGRSAQLSVDTNRHLHRVMGLLFHDSGHWWVSNEGTAIPLHLTDTDSRSHATLGPGSAMAISPGATDVLHTEGTVTMRTDSVPLTEDQRLALAVLAEGALQSPHLRIPVSSNAEMARRIGWTITRFNRKIDNPCVKFSRAGAAGLRGSADHLAVKRRRLLVEHCVENGIVTRSDLAMLDQAGVEPSHIARRGRSQ